METWLLLIVYRNSPAPYLMAPLPPSTIYRLATKPQYIFDWWTRYRRWMTTMPIARPLLKYDRLKVNSAGCFLSATVYLHWLHLLLDRGCLPGFVSALCRHTCAWLEVRLVVRKDCRLIPNQLWYIGKNTWICGCDAFVTSVTLWYNLLIPKVWRLDTYSTPITLSVVWILAVCLCQSCILYGTS